MAKDVRDKGGCLSLADFSAYRAHFAEPLEVAYRGGRVFAAPGMTGGPALAHALQTLTAVNEPSYADYARALETAWTQRLRESGDREAPGAPPACTTHFSVVDRHGNLCAVTQTLLSIFGSRVVSPSTGVLLNNGIMWFDPEPGKPNSLAPGKRCLGNYCPAIGERPDGVRFAIGASGGRKIVGTVLQLASFLIDHGMTLEAAFHHPRIDMSGTRPVIADLAMPADDLRKLEAAFPVRSARRTCFPYAFAVPAGVLRAGELNMGCTEVMSPWGDAVAERSA
jgi:gamma-glutamyltranspeptidase/glutathione hydrolase